MLHIYPSGSLDEMDFSPDSGTFGSLGGDFSRQTGSKSIVNFQGPFYQRGPGDNGPNQHKNSSQSGADHDDMQVTSNSMGNSIKVVSRAGNNESSKAAVDSTSFSRSEHSVNIHVNHPNKHVVDEVEEEEEEDDGEVDPSATVSNSEQTGRWTRKEHEVFLEALKKFGKVHINFVL